MITRDNLHAVFNDINSGEFVAEYQKDHDYMLIELHVFNVGTYTTFKSHDYDDRIAQEAADSGNLFLDKSNLATLLDEVRPDIYDEIA